MYRDDGHSFYFFCFFSVSFPPPPDPLMPNILSFLLSPLLHLIPCVSIIDLHGSTTDAFDAHQFRAAASSRGPQIPVPRTALALGREPKGWLLWCRGRKSRFRVLRRTFSTHFRDGRTFFFFLLLAFISRARWSFQHAFSTL